MMIHDPGRFLALGNLLCAAKPKDDGFIYRFDKTEHFKRIRDSAFRFRKWTPMESGQENRHLHNEEELSVRFDKLRNDESLFRICFFDSLLDALRYWICLGDVGQGYIFSRIGKTSLTNIPNLEICQDRAFKRFEGDRDRAEDQLLGSLNRTQPNNPILELTRAQKNLLSNLRASIYHLIESRSANDYEFSEATLGFEMFGQADGRGGWQNLAHDMISIRVGVIDTLVKEAIEPVV